MKKLYVFMTALLAMFAINANAATKNLYSWSNLQTTDWTGHGNITFNVVSDTEGSYYTFTNGGSGQRGAVTFWGDVIGENTKYSIQLDYNIASYNGTDAGRYLGAEFSFLSADVDATSFNAAGNAVQTTSSVLDFLQKSGDANVAPDWATNTFFVNGNEANIALLPVGSWQTLYIDVDGNNISYQVKEMGNPDGAASVSGTTTVPEGLSNKAIGLYIRMARGQGMLSLANLKITTEIDGAVANKPNVTLTQVKGNDRVYTATFVDGEVLHYILPGGTEQEVSYYDAEDAEGNPGSMELTVTQSGEMKIWTVAESDETVKSEEVSIDVTCGWITLAEPEIKIASVLEGYGKSYNITFNNKDPKHLLPVNYALSYSIDGVNKGEVKDNTVTMEGQGTLTVTVNQIPAYQGAPEYYNRSSATVQNNVEYVVAEEKTYNYTPAELEAMADKFDKEDLGNSGRSQWERVYQAAGADPNALEGRNAWGLWNGTDDKVCDIYKAKDETLAELLAPLCAAETELTGERNNYKFFPYEGIVYHSTSYGNNHDIRIDSKYITDDAAKPNFYILSITTQYDRPDKPAHDTQPGKGDGVFQTRVIKTSDAYSQYRFDNAISKVQVMTYKGFTPGTGIEAIQTVKAAENAPIYNLNGVRVANAAQKGIYIQNGKKFVVK